MVASTMTDERKNQQEEEEAVKITKLQDVTGEIDPVTWPSGTLFVQALASVDQQQQQQQQQQQHSQDPNYWQACVRWAMLTKFGYLNNDDDDMPTTRPDFIAYVSDTWLAAASQPIDESSSSSSDTNDLLDFFRHKGKSRNRSLKFHLMHCPPGCQVSEWVSECA